MLPFLESRINIYIVLQDLVNMKKNSVENKWEGRNMKVLNFLKYWENTATHNILGFSHLKEQSLN